MKLIIKKVSRGVNYLIEGHIFNNWQSQDLNLSNLTVELAPLTTSI